MSPSKPWKCHEDRLYDICFFCRGKAGPQKITPPKKMNDAVKCFEDFDLFDVSSGNMSGSDQKNSLNGNIENDDTEVGICSIED